MNLRNLNDEELLVKVDQLTSGNDLPVTVRNLVDELAWRLNRQLGDAPGTVLMPRFKRGPGGKFTTEPEDDDRRDPGARHAPLLADVRG